MRSIAFMLLSLILSGCQINPYTFQPDWPGLVHGR